MTAQSDASAPPPGRNYSFGAKMWNFSVVVLIFLLVGPPVGAVVFLAMVAVWVGQSSDPETVASVFAVLTIYGLLFSWFIGGLPATLTGLVFATWQTFMGPVRATMAAVAGIAAGLLLTLGAGDIAREIGDPPMLPLYLLTCLAATMACWLLARSFVTAGGRS
ncbi:MAG: hypothetical protein Q8M31_15195 [Beijerinckiaceae bacterium]|nr:hypothetical protein [Beijerinckiaceae bacterium]